jgi:hypothetical protein
MDRNGPDPTLTVNTTGCGLNDLLVWLFKQKLIAAFAPADLARIDFTIGAFVTPA